MSQPESKLSRKITTMIERRGSVARVLAGE